MYELRTRRTVPKSRKRWYGLLIVVTFLMFLFVTEQVMIVILEQRISHVIDETVVLKREVDDLKVEVSNLKKGSRIKRIAVNELGLKMPEGMPGKLF
jgi:cell division protein FtsL